MSDLPDQMTAAEYLAWLEGQKKPRKFHNQPIEADGFHFDSLVEATRYGELKLLERAGEITSLEVHPKFILLYALGDMPQETYEADFQYIENVKIVIEDVKGGTATQTPLWRLKFHLLRLQHPHWDLRVIER